MNRRHDLADRFGESFSVRIARLNGITRNRLRGRDLESPFRGIRVQPGAEADDCDEIAGIDDPYERQRRYRVAIARVYAAGMHNGHFFSHQTAASIWGAPLPLEFTAKGELAEGSQLPLHVSSAGPLTSPSAAGIVGHHTYESLTSVRERDGLRVTSPAATWVSLGMLSVVDLVAAGDFFCRRWRDGHGRPDAGAPPLATIDELASALAAGRRLGASRLREALPLIREDSWSPRESKVRCLLMAAGLPEPQLNIDVHDDHGRFLGCVDMAYPEQRVAIEYLGMLHGEKWAADVERIAALRAAGWNVIEVTAPLLRTPEVLVRRVADALGDFRFV